jgi:hypothetical protein
MAAGADSPASHGASPAHSDTLPGIFAVGGIRFGQRIGSGMGAGSVVIQAVHHPGVA